MSKAQEMRQKTIDARENLSVSAQECYSELLCKALREAEHGFFKFIFTINDIPEELQPFLEDLIIPLF